jgi:hypothetical protein
MATAIPLTNATNAARPPPETVAGTTKPNAVWAAEVCPARHVLDTHFESLFELKGIPLHSEHEQYRQALKRDAAAARRHHAARRSVVVGWCMLKRTEKPAPG